MMQLNSFDGKAKGKETAAAEFARAGLFLVKPGSMSRASASGVPRRSRSLGLLALAAAALAAPLLWFLHEVLTAGR